MNNLLGRYQGKIIGLIVVLGLFGGYAYLQSDELLKGPMIKVDNFTTGQTVDSPFITLSGRAERISKFYLNDNQIFTDDTGHFNQSLLLFPGYNILELRATDAFDREIIKVIRLVRSS